MKTTANYNFTPKDAVKAVADTESLKNVVGVQLEISGAALVEKDGADGQPTTIAYIKTADGNMYGSNSRTVCDAVSAIIDYLTDAGDNATIAVMPKSRKSANKRDFITLDIV